MEKRTHTVTVMGNELPIVSRDSESHVKKVVDFVNDRIKEAKEKSRTVSTQSLALLTALNIADELIKYQEASEEHLHNMLDALEKVK